MTIAAYIRVTESSKPKTTQLSDIKEWITKNNIKHQIVHYYIDSAPQNSTKYTELEQLDRDINAGAIDTVIIHRLENVCKSFTTAAAILCNWCHKSVRVIVVNQSIDIQPESSELAFRLIQALSQVDRETRMARLAVGIEMAKKKGKYKGRKPKIFKKGVNPKRAVTWKRRGRSLSQIAAKLKVSKATVHRYLKLYGDNKDS